MTTFKILTMATILSSSLVNSNGQTTEQETQTTTYDKVASDATLTTTLVITKVQTPWYAWRGTYYKKNERKYS